MQRLCICANCDQTSQCDVHGACVYCGSSSIMVIGNETILRLVRNKRTYGRRNFLLHLLPKVKERIS